jgi:hypothetical protein
MMNPEDPESAHRIVSDYARVLEQTDALALPAPVRLLPYPKQTIKAAIVTCAAALKASQQLTPDLHEFLEQAYVALADYVDEDVHRVMAEYRESLAAMADVRTASDKVQTPAWKRVSEMSRLTGDIARTLADESAALRLEFRARADLGV